MPIVEGFDAVVSLKKWEIYPKENVLSVWSGQLVLEKQIWEKTWKGHSESLFPRLVCPAVSPACGEIWEGVPAPTAACNSFFVLSEGLRMIFFPIMARALTPERTGSPQGWVFPSLPG
jgi:hypothetical protein